MTKADGSIYIDTKINTEGWQKAANDVTKKTNSMKSSLRGLTAEQKTAFNKMANTVSKQVQSLEKLGKSYEQQKAKVAELRSELEKTRNTKIETAEYSKLNAEFDKLEEQMNMLYEKQKDLMSGGFTEEQAYKAVEADLERIGSEMDKVLEKQSAMKASGTAYTTADTTKQESALATAEIKLQDTHANLKQKTAELATSTELLTQKYNNLKNGEKGTSTMSQRIKSAFTKIGTAAKEAGSKTKNFADSLKNSMKSRTSGFAGGLKNILKYSLAIQTVYSLVSKMKSAIKDGLQNLSKYSDTTRASMNSLTSSLTYFKNSLGAAFAPILNVIAPILTKLINYLAQAITYVGMFFAALTGQKTYTAARSVSGVADAANDAADATEKAKKANEDYLSSLDEINRWSSDNDASDSGSGDGSGLGGTGDYFVTETIDNAVGDLADKVKNYFSEIFEPMKSAWETYGEAVIESWKTALSDVVALLEDIAITFKNVWTNGTGEEVCGNILQIIKMIGDAIDIIAVSFKNAWDDSGNGAAYIQSILDIFNSISNVILQIGDSLLTVWSNGTGEKVYSNILQILTNINETAVNIGNNFAEAWEKNNIGTTIIQGIADIANTLLGHVNNITASLRAWANDLNFEPLLTAFSDLTTALEPLADNVGAGLEWFFTNVLEPLAKWAVEQGIPDALNAIAGALEVLNDIIEAVKPIFQWLWENFLQPLAEWTGGTVATILQGIGDGLEWINKNNVVEIALKKSKEWSDDVASVISTAAGKVVSGVVEFSAKVKNDATTWWSNVKSWWADKVGDVKEFGTNVKNGAITWWSNTKSWWSDKVGDVESFATSVKNDSYTWWSNAKSWWAGKVGAAENFSTNVKNEAYTWWNNAKEWWSNRVGSVETFSTNVKNEAFTWWNNAKSWWSSRVGSVEDFKTNVKNDADTWWRNVKEWWSSATSKGTLSEVIATFGTKINDVSGWWSNVKTWWSNAKGSSSLSSVFTAFGTTRQNVSNWWRSVKDWWGGAKGVLPSVYTAFGTTQRNVSSWWRSVKEWWSGAKGMLSSAYTQLGTNKVTVSGWWGTVKTWWGNAKGMLSSVYTSLGTSYNTVRSWWNTIVSWWGNKNLSVNVSATYSGGNGRSFEAGGIVNKNGLTHKLPQFESGGKAANGMISLWNSIPKYASGTNNAHGTMFVAGENGAEIVGNINGRTEILNKSQIASAIYSAVLKGMSEAVNNLGAYIANHMSSCTNAQISAILYASDKFNSGSATAVQVPYIASGAVIPPQSKIANTNILNQDNRALIAKLDSLISMLSGQTTNGSKYQFVAQINGRTLFDETIDQGRLIRATSGNNPFELA